MEKDGSVYIMTNVHHTELYTGVASDLYTRVCEHREKLYPKSFTSRYNLFILVYYENFHLIEEAIAREKQIKQGQGRRRKNWLIQQTLIGMIYSMKLKVGDFTVIAREARPKQSPNSKTEF